MSNTVFSTLFAVPAIPAEIHGASCVSMKGGVVSAVVFGEGSTPAVRGAALLALIGAAAFNGGEFAALPESPKGNARKVLAAVKDACLVARLPACKGGKAPRALLSSEVQAFIDAMIKSMGDVVEHAPAAPKLPEVTKFLEKFGTGADMQAFAGALLAACGGAITLELERAASVEKALTKTVKKAA